MNSRLVLSKTTANGACLALTFLFVLTLSCIAESQTVTTTLEFDNTNGRYPQIYSSFTQGRDGNIIGTVAAGGPDAGFGYVFRERPGTAAVNTLYNFGHSDGYSAQGGVILARDGNYYGTLTYGGTYNFGSLYRLSPSGVFTALHAFTNGTDGAQPYAAPIEGSDGNLYGTTSGVTTNATVYKYTAQGVFSVIYTFTDSSFITSVLEGSDGSLYLIGGSGLYGCGTIVKMTKVGVVKYTHSFDCNGGGSGPIGQLFEGNDGSIYGTTRYGGIYNLGVAYKLDPATGVQAVLHDFGSTPNDGYYTYGGMTQGSDGNFYGTTSQGGDYTCGTIYQLTPSGGYSQVYSFPLAVFGAPLPFAAPYQNTNGKFFGATLYGGSYGFGTLYTLDMGLGPFITFVRSQGKVGSKAQILGQGLTGTTSVTFNGVPASSFNVVKDRYMTAVVPTGATTGPVVVTTPSGTLTSNKNFRISQ